MGSPELRSVMDRILEGGIEAVASDVDVRECVDQASGSQGDTGEHQNRRVSAVPSANNSLTFFVDDLPDRESSSEEDDQTDVTRNLSALDVSENESMSRERELTEKYLAGEMTFKEFVSEFNQEDEDVSSENEDSEMDEEWKPPGKKSKKARAPQGALKEAVDVDHHVPLDADSADEECVADKSQRRRGGGRRKKLDPALQGLMGEAHLRFARGDTENGKKMCLEIIRQDPSAPEPFQALANLYEEGDEIEKGLQFALLAAQLAPPDPDEWSRLADMSLEQGDVLQACFCYKKAIEADPINSRFYFTRCNLLEQIGDKKAALRCYKKLLVNLKESQGEEYLQGAREAARLLHERDQLDVVEQLYDLAFTKHPDFVTDSDTNLFLELLIIRENYQHALEICCRHCGVHFSCENSSGVEVEKLAAEEQLAAFTELEAPDELAAEIKCKLIIILANLKAIHLATSLTDMFVDADPEEFGELMLDISEAFVKNSLFEEALVFQEKLVNSENFSEPGVWLQFAECLNSAGRLEDAEEAFKQVVFMAPNHYTARLKLSVIMRTLGRPEDALLALDQDETEEMLNPHLLLQRCQLLIEENKIQEFLVKSKLLFSRHFVNIRNKEELHAVSSAKKISSKNRALNEVRSFRREPLDESEAPGFQETQEAVTVQEEFALFMKVCDILFEEEKYEELQRLAFSALGSPTFARNIKIHKECEFLCLLSSFFNGDSYHAYNSVRDIVVKDVKNSAIWNMFNLVIMRADDVRHNRFLMRLMSRNPDNLALGILNGHNCLVAGTYKYSLGEYMSVFKQDSSNPLIALMLGLTFCHMACQKFSAKKHSLVVQACAFLNTYKELRGDCQEVNYNLGRAMHQLSLLPAALFYYKKALTLGPSVEQAGPDSIFDLKREIAYNISLIYQNSGNYDLARMYSEKYIVI